MKKSIDIQSGHLNTIKQRTANLLNNPLIGAPFSLRIPISLWSFALIKQYFQLRKELLSIDMIDKSEKNLFKLSFNAWLLGKYVFEFVFIVFHLIIFTTYIFKVPTYKGMMSFYIGFFFFSYYFLGHKIIRYNHSIQRRLILINEVLCKKLATKK